ncbi:MAG: hypothetical protein M1816_005375 [Peltula sp. TS41687]|nr:MAG: hypothetical protein M1816_005375 [Peltula sp. TS41687]
MSQQDLAPEPWRSYFADEINRGHQEGEHADRFEQYLVCFQNADVSVYVSDLVDDASGMPRWQTGPEKTPPPDGQMDGGFRSALELDAFLSKDISEDVKFRLITVDATSTEVIQLLGHRFNMAHEFFQHRAFMRKSHEAKLHGTQRLDHDGQTRKRRAVDCYTVIEAIDYVWLGESQPAHVRMREKAFCAFELETPYQEGNYPYIHPAFLWRNASGNTMAAMPRKISFYLIFGKPGTRTVCLMFLETIACIEPSPHESFTLHLSSRTGTTVIWQEDPAIKGMFFAYFLFDCFGCLQPQPWNAQAYNSRPEKQENNQRLAKDGRWALCSFFKTLGALTDFTLAGWNGRLSELSEEALNSPHRWLATVLHSHLDDIYLHQEKSQFHIRLGRLILAQERKGIFHGGRGIARVLEEYITNSEYALRRYDRVEKKITNTIAMIFNTATIDEARSSAMQNARIGFLTILASLFIPLNFLATLFGMNVKELNQPTAETLPSMRLYWAIAVPTTAAVFLLAFILRIVSRSTLSTRLAKAVQDVEDVIFGGRGELETDPVSAGIHRRKRRTRAQQERVRNALAFNVVGPSGEKYSNAARPTSWNRKPSARVVDGAAV